MILIVKFGRWIWWVVVQFYDYDWAIKIDLCTVYCVLEVH